MPSILSGATITASPQAILNRKLPLGLSNETLTVVSFTTATSVIPENRAF